MPKKKRTYRNMSYREVQWSNSTRRLELTKDLQLGLKQNGYRNVAWENVIALYDEITRLQYLENLSIEELYLEADRIGNKYQTREEVISHRKTLAREVDKISETLDQFFPASPREEIDYRKSRGNRQMERKR